MQDENPTVSTVRSPSGLVRRCVRLVAISVLSTLTILGMIVTFGPGKPVPPAWAQAPEFDLRSATVDSRLIRAGGPPKDGIPAITNPRFLKADEAKYLRPDDRVIGVMMHEQSRAYQLAILNYCFVTVGF